MTDLDLINKVKNENDSGALVELVNRHTGLYIKIVDKYSYPAALDKNDMIDNKLYNIYQYALDYDPTKNMKFPVYLGQRLKWDCYHVVMNAIQSEEIKPEMITEEINLSDEDTVKFIVENTTEITDKRFFDIFKLRHLVDKPWTWKRIGKKIGMTHEGARKVYLHNIEFLRRRLKKEHLFAS